MTFALGGCGSAGDDAGAQETNSVVSQSTALSHGGPVKDHVSFLDSLRRDGVTVDIVGSATAPGAVTGTRLRLSGQGIAGAEVDSFEYQKSADAAGAEPTSVAGATASARVYRIGRLVVVYGGDDAAVAAILARELGPAVSGG
jgi:hypothetical protein